MSFYRIFMFFHDGIYSINSGAGVMNYRLIVALSKLGYLNEKFFISPIYVNAKNNDYNKRWFTLIKKYLEKSKANFCPIDNGTNGKIRYGNITQWLNGASFAYYKIIKPVIEKQKDKKFLILSADTPFIYLIKLLANHKNILHIHIPHSVGILHSPQNKERLILEKESFELANLLPNTYIGLIGKFMGNLLIEKYCLKRRKTIKITNGILKDEFYQYSHKYLRKILKQLKVPLNQKILLAYGRAVYYKGFDILLKSYKYLRKSKERPYLIMITPKEKHELKYFQNLRRLFKKYKIKGLIKGEFDYLLPRIIIQFENTIGVIVPSRKEPFGLIPIEIMGNPYSRAIAIVSNVGEFPYVIKNAKNGFIFKINNPKMLARQIKMVLNLNEKERQKIKENAFKIVYKKYNYLENVKNFWNKLNNLNFL